MSFPRPLCASWTFAVSFWIGSLSLAAGNTGTGLSQGDYSIRIWQTEDGLPQNSVTAITQTRDGYIWIGTYGGLARFDGERFENFDAVTTPALVDSRIVSLYEDVQGVLWIGHDSGRLTSYRAGHFEPFRESLSRAGDKINAISADSTGLLWLLRSSGTLESVTNPSLQPLMPPTSPSNLGSLTRTTNGTLFVARDGEVAQLVEGKLTPINFGPAHHTGFVMGLGAAGDGGLWVIRDWQVKKWKSQGWTENRGPCPWGESSITTVIEMRDGTLAVGTMDQGIYLLSTKGGVVHFDRNNGLSQNWVRFLFEDREGNLWVGAGTGGLVALRSTAFSVINAPDQWQGRTVLCVAPGRDGALWIGTEGAGVYRYLEGKWSHYGEEEGLENLFVWSLTEDPEGQIWAGTWAGGIYKMQWEHFVRTAEVDPLTVPVLALQFTAADRGLWVGTGGGLLHVENGNTTWPFHKEGGGAGAVPTVTRDLSGTVWFGLSEAGGLGRLTNGKVSLFRKKDGLSSDSVQCLLADEDGALWIGTADGGLNRLKDGKFSSIGLNEGLASNVICHLSDDGRGYLWLSTHHGILRLAKSELNHCADGFVKVVTGQVYDRNDGLPTIEYSGGLQAAGCQTTDGRLWFTSSKGLVSVDPSAIRLNPLPPPVSLESLRVDGRPLELVGRGVFPNLQLAPDHERLEFHYSGLSLIAPSKVLFKYRLIGLEKEWVEAGTKRTAFYSHLPPGNYSFQVTACNNDGLWNLQGAALPFAVLPFFWQTWWFRGLAAVAILSAVALAVRAETRRRMQRGVEHLQRQHALERERARIAQDIHDDIGASLTRITMLSQSVRAELKPPPEAAAILERIYDTSREVTRSLDEIVWAVDPRHDTLDSLVCYMGKFAQDFLAAAEVRCRLDLPVNLPAWSLTTETRHNLFLAFKETLNNTLKHAAATEVRISLSLEPQAFVLILKDNGRGFDVNRLPTPSHGRIAAGNGLENLHRRLVRIGGSCKITTSPGMGTSVSFIVHASDSSRDAPPPHLEHGIAESPPLIQSHHL